MFNNIGGKIKALAKVLCWIGIIISVLIAIVVFIAAGEAGQVVFNGYRYDSSSMILPGILILILGPLLSWINSFLLYGFGTLVENSEFIKYGK